MGRTGVVGSCLTTGAGILNLIDELRGSGVSDGARGAGAGAGENAGPNVGAGAGGWGAVS
jgi:hypothetical protein